METKQRTVGNSLAFQWLGPSTLAAKGLGSIRAWGTKIPQAMWCGLKEKKRKQKNSSMVGTCLKLSVYMVDHVDNMGILSTRHSRIQTTPFR